MDGFYKLLGIKDCFNRNRFAFIVGLCGGLVGVLADFDHFIAYLFRVPFTGDAWRLFHPAYLVIGSLFIIFSGTRIGRYYVKMVLRKE